jgi:hypothetical protein
VGGFKKYDRGQIIHRFGEENRIKRFFVVDQRFRKTTGFLKARPEVILDTIAFLPVPYYSFAMISRV